MDESELTSMEVKVPKSTILRHCSQLMKQYFDKKSEASKCQLFLAFIKSRSMETIRRNLGIRTMKNINQVIALLNLLLLHSHRLVKKLVHKTVRWLVMYWLNQFYVDPQDNIVYLNAHHNLCLYIQRHLKIFSKKR